MVRFTIYGLLFTSGTADPGSRNLKALFNRPFGSNGTSENDSGRGGCNVGEVKRGHDNLDLVVFCFLPLGVGAAEDTLCGVSDLALEGREVRHRSAHRNDVNDARIHSGLGTRDDVR